jgi:hypothetical protein
MNAAADLAAVLMILFGVRHYEPQRPKAWWLLAGGLAAWLVADSIFGAYQIGRQGPLSVDRRRFYLLGYALLVAGLLRAVRVRSPVFDVRALFDPAIITVGRGRSSVGVRRRARRPRHEAGTFETVVSVGLSPRRRAAHRDRDAH